MKNIVFYLSDHGFGHAARNIPIIKFLLDNYNDINIVVRTGVAQGNFIKSVINNDSDNRINYYLENMDIGIVLKDGSLEIDKEKLLYKVENYIDTWKERIENEKKFFITNKIDVVVCDIVPWVLKAAADVNIPSILISNFTWVDIYKEYLDNKIIDKYLDCYKNANKTLLYELYNEDMNQYLQNCEKVSLCARDFNDANVNDIRSSIDKPIVFVSVGRSVSLNNTIDVSNLNYHFFVTEGINLKGDNVCYLPLEINNTQDYIKASNYVITKAGWGTLAEVLLAQKKVAVFSRDTVAEDRNTINKLIDMNLAIKVNYDNSFNIEKILNDLNKLHINYNNKTFSNDYKKISEIIVSYIS